MQTLCIDRKIVREQALHLFMENEASSDGKRESSRDFSRLPHMERWFVGYQKDKKEINTRNIINKILWCLHY